MLSIRIPFYRCFSSWRSVTLWFVILYHVFQNVLRWTIRNKGKIRRLKDKFWLMFQSFFHAIIKSMKFISSPPDFENRSRTWEKIYLCWFLYYRIWLWLLWSFLSCPHWSQIQDIFLFFCCWLFPCIVLFLLFYMV